MPPRRATRRSKRIAARTSTLPLSREYLDLDALPPPLSPAKPRASLKKPRGPGKGVKRSTKQKTKDQPPDNQPSSRPSEPELPTSIQRVMKDLDVQVHERCAEIRTATSKMAASISFRGDLAISRLPRLLRDLPMSKFLDLYHGNPYNVYASSAQSRVQHELLSTPLPRPPTSPAPFRPQPATPWRSRDLDRIRKDGLTPSRIPIPMSSILQSPKQPATTKDIRLFSPGNWLRGARDKRHIIRSKGNSIYPSSSSSTSTMGASSLPMSAKSGACLVQFDIGENETVELDIHASPKEMASLDPRLQHAVRARLKEIQSNLARFQGFLES